MDKPRVLAFMITRALGEERLAVAQKTIEDALSTAGYDFDFRLHTMSSEAFEHFMPIGGENAERFTTIGWKENRGQHVVFNEALTEANDAGYDYLLRLDDDCEFLTKQWLKKLVDAAEKLGPDFIISPTVKGLVHPPERSESVNVKGVKCKFLTHVIGGICRLHNVKNLVEGKYVSDVRSPLGFGDATGIGKWAQENRRWMVYLDQVRVRHAHGTLGQMERDPEYHDQHDLFQHLPYIPLRGV